MTLQGFSRGSKAALVMVGERVVRSAKAPAANAKHREAKSCMAAKQGFGRSWNANGVQRAEKKLADDVGEDRFAVVKVGVVHTLKIKAIYLRRRLKAFENT